MSADPNTLDYFSRAESLPVLRGKIATTALDTFSRGEVFPGFSASTSAFTGTSAVIATPATVAATGTQTFSGSSSLTATPATIAASGTLTFSGSAALTASPSTLSASGTVGAAALSGGASLTATPAVIAGVGNVSMAAPAAPPYSRSFPSPRKPAPPVVVASYDRLKQAQQLSSFPMESSLPEHPRLERIDPASVMKYNADVQLFWDRVRQQYAANMQALIQQVKGQ